MHVATVEELDRALLPAVAQLRATLDRKAHDYADVVMLGRTHLQDATPVTLGQVISGWVAQLDDAAKYLHHARDALHPLALGGTAVGTGINSPARFGERVAHYIAAGDRQAVHVGAQQVCGAVRARRHGQCERRAAHAGRHRDEDRQRRAPLRERAPRGFRRDHHSRQRAGIVDHAGQDQSDAERGADDGRRAGVRQRHRGGVRGHAGPLPAQRLQARHPAQHPGIDRAPRRRHSAPSTSAARAGSSPTASASAATSRSR